MTIWTALILGLLIGWLVEWVIDWWFWRRRSTAPMSARTSEGHDHLEDIYGIGPVIADRLRKAGIMTFEQLADLKPDEVREIAQLEIEDDADFRSFVSQAKDFARRRQQEK
jgi:predicted flap endonuclease-1-like 5' DNA nuclease